MATRMQQRRGTAQQWTDANPRLAAGEIGFETDTGKFKVGDDVNFWDDLAYFVNTDDLEGELGAYATEEFVNDAVSGILDGAPGVLDTLNELAAALGDDPSFITTIQEDFALKADTTAAQGFADTAESNANGYTDAVIGDASVDGTGGNTVTDRIASAIAGLVDSSPAALNTLNELAEALGDDPNFATTVSTSIGTKVSKSGDTMTGALTLAADPTATFHAATKGYVDVELSSLSSTLESADSTISSSLSDLSTSVSNLSDDVTSLTSEVNDLTGSVASSTSTLSEEIDIVETAVDNLTSSLNDLSSDVGTITSDLGNLTTLVDTKAPLDAPTFTGAVVLPVTTSIGDVSSAELGHLNGVTDPIQTQIDAKAPTANPTFTGTVVGVTKAMVGLGDVDNTTDAAKPVSTAAQAALDLKAPLESPTFTGTVAGVTKSHVGLANVDNTSDADKPVSTATQTALDAKASLAGATFTGDVTVETNMLIEGNLTISGTSTTINATDLAISDPLIYLASEQYAQDVLDVGFLAATGEVGGTEASHLHSGLFRDVSDDKKWKLISNVPHPVSNVVDVTNAVKDTLVVGNIEADGVVFTDGTQTKVGVASISEFVQTAESFTLDDLDLRDTILEVGSSSAKTVTIPTDSALAWPIGASMDIIATGTGEVSIVADSGVTINSTPGLKLRTQWSSATILKRAANTWIAYGDLKA
jgi:uncharacterized protein YoxC